MFGESNVRWSEEVKRLRHDDRRFPVTPKRLDCQMREMKSRIEGFYDL